MKNIKTLVLLFGVTLSLTSCVTNQGGGGTNGNPYALMYQGLYGNAPLLANPYTPPNRITPFTCSKVGNYVNCV